ncbi:MAG: hypothetical protein Q9191_002768 [Dirinaria sp. TL-2023a]
MQPIGVKMPAIPLRGSSKNATLEAIAGEKRKLGDDADEMTRKVKVSTSFDSEFWLDLSQAETKRLETSRLQRKISMISMELDETDVAAVRRWQASSEGQKCLQEEEALKRKVEILERQAKSLQIPLTSKALRCVNLQTQFRRELETEMEVRDPKLGDTYWWCPVRGEFCEGMRAGHLFPSKCGDEAMRVIFGEAELDKSMLKLEEGKSELFRAVNGILWSEAAEKRFSEGYFCIVPDLDENATRIEVQAWQRSPIKEYRIRVLSPGAKLIKEPLSAAQLDMLWKDIDGRRLDFKGKTFRPRARYVYWSYIEIMLRHFYAESAKVEMMSAGEVGRQNVGKNYWGSAGSYMRRNQLLGFVEAMEHEYEHLLEAAIEEEEEESESEAPSNTAVMVANENVLQKNKALEDGVVEDEDEDEDEDDDE